MNDWLPELTDDDLNALFEALEAWESKDFGGEIMGELLAATMFRGDPATRADFDRSQREDKQKRERAKALRKERSVLLRAKLLTLRDRRRVEDVTVRTKDQA